jgi:hypothetical protein
MRALGAIVVVVLAAAVLVFLFAPRAVSRYIAYDQYVCTSCGLKKTQDVRKFGYIEYRRKVTFEDSAVSRALNVTNCQHSWFLYRFGHDVIRPLRSSSYADGGSHSMNLPILLIDDRFSQELARMENAPKAWGSLVTALDSSRQFDELFAEWWQNSDHVSLSTWAATNRFWTGGKN